MTKREMERKTFDIGQPLFLEGDRGDHAYLIEEGVIDIIKTAAGGKDVVIAKLSRGDIVGEMALVDSAPRGATAKAAEFTKAAIITKDFFNARVEGSSPMIRMLLTCLAKRIRDTNYSAVNAPSEGWRTFKD